MTAMITLDFVMRSYTVKTCGKTSTGSVPYCGHFVKRDVYFVHLCALVECLKIGFLSTYGDLYKRWMGSSVVDELQVTTDKWVST